MNAVFNIKVNITEENVTTTVNCDEMKEMDPMMVSTVMKSFIDLQGRIRTQMSKFYGIQKEQQNAATGTEEQEAAVEENPQETESQSPEN